VQLLKVGIWLAHLLLLRKFHLERQSADLATCELLRLAGTLWVFERNLSFRIGTNRQATAHSKRLECRTSLNLDILVQCAAFGDSCARAKHAPLRNKSVLDGAVISDLDSAPNNGITNSAAAADLAILPNHRLIDLGVCANFGIRTDHTVIRNEALQVAFDISTVVAIERQNLPHLRVKRRQVNHEGRHTSLDDIAGDALVSPWVNNLAKISFLRQKVRLHLIIGKLRSIQVYNELFFQVAQLNVFL